MPSPEVDGDGSLPPQKDQPKALRFVTSYGAPHPKRRRIGAACLTCRKRKTACSGERPFCETCKQTKQECIGYSEAPPTPHHRRTTSDVGTCATPIAGIKSRSGSLNWVKRQPAIFEELPHKKASRSSLPGIQHPYPAHVGGNQGLNRSHGGRDYRSHEVLSAVSGAQNSHHAHVEDIRTLNGVNSEPDRVQPHFAGPRNRMPYFRWLGPTAIMPGFKQMVVKVKRQEAELARSSTDGGSMLSPSLTNIAGDQGATSFYSGAPAAVESDVRTPLALPFYDTSPMPPSELITHLGNTFFTHLGCNYPFLQRERFLRDLEEKQVDAILVDAVCALAARFSTHALLKQQPHDEAKATPAEYGHAFAQRAKTALVDTFACPSVAAVQAALLLAYNEFGESRDSGLWMYLGIAIRMVQDLGMHKLEGLKFMGITGPTPKLVKRDSNRGTNPLTNGCAESVERRVGFDDPWQSQKEIDEQKAVEQERVDTFWAVFFLDRVVSSGTGRRSTLRDKEIELSFPNLEAKDPTSGWPAVFPALIRIVHLYGRVADLLNGVEEPADITAETRQRLADTELQVTQFYQGLSPRLHFDAVNFQHYMKAGEGTNFVLLHFWFHTMIVLLHQPTLLKTFEGGMLQLVPNSQQLSLSSAKTIADILSYSQLMDAKASLGNPFTTQPIYIAACAFLKETAEQTATSNAQSRASSPSRRDIVSENGPSTNGTPNSTKQQTASSSSSGHGKTTPVDQKALAKHTLLATAASQHYQLCYKALQSLETYWAGTKYILTVLDQKFEGVGDPLLYTVEEGESSMERPRPEPAFTSPGWRRKLSGGQCLNANSFLKVQGLAQIPGSPGVDPNKAIGWTLTGTMNSPSTHLAWHYSSAGADSMQTGQADSSLPPTEVNTATANGQYNQMPGQGSMRPGSGLDTFARPILPSFQRQNNSVSTADADLLLSLGSPYPSDYATPDLNPPNGAPHVPTPAVVTASPVQQSFDTPFTFYTGNGQMHMQNFGDMLIESRDVDMSELGFDMPWFDLSMQDTVSTFFDVGAAGEAQGGSMTQHRAPS